MESFVSHERSLLSFVFHGDFAGAPYDGDFFADQSGEVSESSQSLERNRLLFAFPDPGNALYSGILGDCWYE